MSRVGLDSCLGAGAAEIRPFDPVDAPAVSALLRLLFDERAEWISESAGIDEVSAYTAARAIAERAETHQILVAWQGPRPVGVIEVRATGDVSLLMVRRLSRGGEEGLGVAMALVACAEEACRAAGHPGMNVHSSLEARTFYERLGFEAVGEPQRAHGLIFVPMTKAL